MRSRPFVVPAIPLLIGSLLLASCGGGGGGTDNSGSSGGATLAGGCRPGLVAGFTGAQNDTLSRVVGSNSGDGSPGGIGGGDGAGDGASGGVGIGGSLGRFSAVDVTAEFASGERYTLERVDSPNGMVTLVPCSLQPPVLVTVSGAAGSGATYYDEALGLQASFEGQTLRSVLTRLDRNGGVTPFTEAMFQRLTLVHRTAVDGGAGDTLAVKDVGDWKIPARVEAAHAEVAEAVNDLLPGRYRVEDLRRLPVVLGASNATAGSASLADTPNGVYGAVLAGVARVAANLQPAATNPALQAATQFVADLTDGVRDLRATGGPVTGQGTGGVGRATYDYPGLSSRLAVETGRTAALLGAGSLQSDRPVVQWLQARSGTSFANAPSHAIALLADGTVAITAAAGAAAAPALPADARFMRIDVFDRSTRTYGTGDPTTQGVDVTEPGVAGNWQNCVVATAADGRTLYAWAVGRTPAAWQTRAVGTVADPVISVAPESLSADIAGGDSVMVVRRSGATLTTAACDQQDFHPGMVNAVAVEPSRYVVQVLQDFGNRYFVFSDGQVEAWGITSRALGIGSTSTGATAADQRRPVIADQNGVVPAAVPPNATALSGVVMVARGDNLQQTRALLRSPTAAEDGSVVAWGADLPIPRKLDRATLGKACHIAGPYVVGCDGRLFHVAVTGVGGVAQTVITLVPGVPAIWRVHAGLPATRSTASNPGWQPGDGPIRVTGMTLAHTAVAVDGRTYRLTGTSAVLQ